MTRNERNALYINLVGIFASKYPTRCTEDIEYVVKKAHELTIAATKPYNKKLINKKATTWQRTNME